MKSLVYEKISNDNLELATKTQNSIFPDENGYLNFKCSIDEDFYRKLYNGKMRETTVFWICKDKKGDVVGITGIYSYFEYPEDAWLGWYGVLPKYRKQGYGKEILLWTIEKAKEMGFKNFRLYTDLVENNTAVELYKKLGMVGEPYLAEDMGEEQTFIFSKSLNSNPVQKIGDQMLFLKEQEEVQEKAEKFLKNH